MASATAETIHKRPTRPDQAAFESGVEALEKDLKAKSDKQDHFHSQLKLLNPDSAQSERQKELREQLAAVKKRQAEIRAANQKVFEEIKSLDELIKRKVKEVQAAKSKLTFKSPEELDSHIKKLESTVDSGTLKIVEEKRLLSDISALKKSRKSFASVQELEQSIAESREKVAALRSKAEDKESKELSAKHNALQAELNGIRGEVDAVMKNRSALVEQLNAARKAKDEAYAALRSFKNEFYKQKKEFARFEQEEKQKRWERKKAEREEFEREKRKKRAAQKLEAASEPAFEADIGQAESLLQYFDPTFKPTAASARAASTLAAAPTRTVDAAPPAGTQVLSKKAEEEYFVGKKGKKKNTNSGGGAEKDKFTLNVEIVNQLSALSIGVPMSRDEVPAVVEALKAKVAWFKDNQARVTAENIEKAQAEIDRLERDAEAPAVPKDDKKRSRRPKTEDGTPEADADVPQTPAEAEVEAEADAEVAAEVAAEELKPAEQ